MSGEASKAAAERLGWDCHMSGVGGTGPFASSRLLDWRSFAAIGEAPQGRTLLAVIEDDANGGGRWLELIAWNHQRECWMPQVALSDPTNWFRDVKETGARITYWAAVELP